ncbi:MAG TPA: FtsX-like permease family protein, partial [Steroidobacteraceae bacterium]|nr:FtsX-like permease family protein [Steroidobacteraceae bacterium]
MRMTLAAAALRRHRTRTILAILGVAVSAALLLDMVMLSSGMRVSFRELLTSVGFQLRLAPKGTLPFDTEATIANADDIARRLRLRDDVVAVSPVLGAALHVAKDDRTITSVALGIEPLTQGDYLLESGQHPLEPNWIVVNTDFLSATGSRPGDTITVATGYDPQLRTFQGSQRVLISGTARFLYMAREQLAVAMPIATLQRLSERPDRVSLYMIKSRDGADVEQLRTWMEREFPTVNAISTSTALQQVDDRLSYFRQLAFVLGAISLTVGFLLVTTLMTVSVNERLGEIAVLRAIGVSRTHVVQQIVMEGIAISVLGAALGLALGLVTARYLNAILS